MRSCFLKNDRVAFRAPRLSFSVGGVTCCRSSTLYCEVGCVGSVVVRGHKYVDALSSPAAFHPSGYNLMSGYLSIQISSGVRRLSGVGLSSFQK